MKTSMIEKLIDDCEKALENNIYMAALNLALTLPDICAKAKYPAEKSNKKRYVDWYEEYIGQYDKYPKFHEGDKEPAYPSGEVIYSLRCSMLHQGTPNIDDKCDIAFFSLIYETTKPIYMYLGEGSGSSPGGRNLSVHINILCWKICTAVKQYYAENKAQFNFFNYRLIDRDEVMKQRAKKKNYRCLNTEEQDDSI